MNPSSWPPSGDEMKIIPVRKTGLAMQSSMILFTAVVAANIVLAEERWWQFRGPLGNGHTQSSDLPLKWDEKEAVWKTPVHDRGWYSPVIEEG